MSTTLDRLLSEALELTSADRAALAHCLIASLDEDADDDPADIELEWEQEIQRRLAEYRRGEVTAVSSTDVFAKARALLNR